METVKQIFLQHAFSSLKLSAVIILLLAFTKPIAKRYTAGFRYYSWLAVMLIFLIPFGAMGISYTVNFSSLTNVVNVQSIREWYSENAPEQSITEEYIGSERIEGKTESADKKKSEVQYVPVTKTAVIKVPVDITAILALLWLIGALIYFVLHTGRYIGFKRSMRRLCQPVGDKRIQSALDVEKRRLGISKDIQINLFPLTDTPMLTGYFRPEIILPHTGYTDEELSFILRHELLHLKRNDILYQFITLIFISLHWFNPFVYLMARAIEIDGETSCDEKTLEGKAYEERIFYGEMLLKFLRTTTQKKSYMTTTFFGGKKGMKKRLNLIKSKAIRKKGTAAMAVIMSMTVLLSTGAAAMGSEYFNSVFEGDTSYLADFIKTEKKSVEDDRFKLTLEQYLVAENQAMLICSLEAKTADAIEEINAPNEKIVLDKPADAIVYSENEEVLSSAIIKIDTMNFAPTDTEKASLGGYVFGSLDNKKFDTESKKYYIIKCIDIKNDDKIDFCISTSRIKGAPKITVPMDYNIETKILNLDTITVKYNPISISINYPTTDDKSGCDWCNWNGGYFYFRMKNDEVKTFHQLYDRTDWDNDYTNAWAKRIIEPDEIKSIIVNGIEYPVDNPSQTTAVTIDNNLQPFTISSYANDTQRLPLRELCDGLGAEVIWDNDTQSATVKYRGSTYVFTVGSTKVKINGETVDFYDEFVDNTAFVNENGRMIVLVMVQDYMDIDCHGLGNPLQYERWHIIP